METLILTSTVYQVAEVQLSYKKAPDHLERPRISHSRDAFKVLLDTWNKDNLEYFETFKILMLDCHHTVIALYEVSSGGTTTVIVEAKLVFTAALKANAHTIILCHNHPSGYLVPSQPDKNITRDFKQIGSLLHIEVVDHLIITTDRYYSFADEGLL